VKIGMSRGTQGWISEFNSDFLRGTHTNPETNGFLDFKLGGINA